MKLACIATKNKYEYLSCEFPRCSGAGYPTSEMNFLRMKKYIKILTLIIAFFFVIDHAFAQEPPSEKFDKGVEYYKAASFREALDAWLDIYNTGYRSASLNYNIGNAYFKLNNIPGAILFYERARLLKPGNDNIEYNLQIARSMVVDKFEEIPSLFFVRWYDFLSLLLTTNKWAIISLVSFILFLISLSVYLYSSAYRIKVTSFWIALALMAISVFALSFTVRNRTLVYNSRSAVIFSPSVNGKSSPDESGTDLFILHEGSKVKIEDEVGQWYEIRLSDGNKGWVPSDCLSII
jgi:tetratricopeptide (TPR) repeat protein